MGLPQLLAGLDIQKGGAKENSGVEKHSEILHGISSNPREGLPGSKNDSARSCVGIAEGNAKGKIKAGLRADRVSGASS